MEVCSCIAVRLHFKRNCILKQTLITSLNDKLAQRDAGAAATEAQAPCKDFAQRCAQSDWHGRMRNSEFSIYFTHRTPVKMRHSKAVEYLAESRVYAAVPHYTFIIPWGLLEPLCASSLLNLFLENLMSKLLPTSSFQPWLCCGDNNYQSVHGQYHTSRNKNFLLCLEPSLVPRHIQQFLHLILSIGVCTEVLHKLIFRWMHSYREHGVRVVAPVVSMVATLSFLGFAVIYLHMY